MTTKKEVQLAKIVEDYVKSIEKDLVDLNEIERTLIVGNLYSFFWWLVKNKNIKSKA